MSMPNSVPDARLVADRLLNIRLIHLPSSTQQPAVACSMSRSRVLCVEVSVSQGTCFVPRQTCGRFSWHLCHECIMVSHVSVRTVRTLYTIPDQLAENAIA